MNIVSVFLFLNCMIGGHAQDYDSIMKIEFSTLTRGAHQTIVFTKNQIETTKQTHNDNVEKRTFSSLSAKQWEVLLLPLSALALAEIPTLTSPTKARAYDGARHSAITITTNSGKTFSHNFDNENPHERLKPLMREIAALVRLETN